MNNYDVKLPVDLHAQPSLHLPKTFQILSIDKSAQFLLHKFSQNFNKSDNRWKTLSHSSLYFNKVQ